MRSFQTGDFVYLFNPAAKFGLSRKFRKPWSGPYRITAKISDLNCEIEDQNFTKQVVHLNRLKKAYNFHAWKPKAKQKGKRKNAENHRHIQRKRRRNKKWPLPIVTKEPARTCN